MVYETVNEGKLDGIIGKELAEGYLKIVKDKPDCIYSMGAVPTLDGGIRPITDCSMPRDISVNNNCDDIIVDFQYKKEINGETVYIEDSRLCFGLRLGPSYFDKSQDLVIKVLRYLVFYISWGKVTPPSQVCRYLGLDIDSQSR